MAIHPVVKWGVRVLGIVAVLGLTCLFGLRIYGGVKLAAAERAFRERVGSLDPTAWGAPDLPEQDNAAVPVRAGALGVVLGKADGRLVGELTQVPVISWNNEQKDHLRTILRSNASALELLHRSFDLPRASFGVELVHDFALKERMPLVKIMWAARLLHSQARLARIEGDRAGMLHAVESMSGVARAVHQEPLLVCQLIGIAVERMMLSALHEIAVAPEVTPEELSRLESVIGTSDVRAAWRRSMAVEALLSGDVKVITAARAWDQGSGTTARPVARLVPSIYRSGVLETGIELQDLVDEPCGSEPSRMNALLERTAPSSVDMAMNIGFASARAVGRFQALVSQRQAARIALALRRQSLSGGAYPATLAAFAGATDRDPFTGEPLVYERRPDGSARLDLPGAEELWSRQSDIKNQNPFLWELPAPGIESHAPAAARP